MKSEVIVMEITIGLFAGIFDENGKVLLRRRKRENPNFPCSYEGDWELPGGTMEEENIWKEKDERVIGEELVRELIEEIGLSIAVPFMPAMYPVVYINKERKIIDFAFILPIGFVKERPSKGENIYVDPKKLKDLAGHSEGNRLVSGWGKRMCKLVLMALQHSPNSHYQQEANSMLLEIHEMQS
jgi:8-oxo-dGTP pyrophosphatase MutT (NUDIX family)